MVGSPGNGIGSRLGLVAIGLVGSIGETGRTVKLIFLIVGIHTQVGLQEEVFQRLILGGQVVGVAVTIATDDGLGSQSDRILNLLHTVTG